jgi:hypothetical protein
MTGVSTFPARAGIGTSIWGEPDASLNETAFMRTLASPWFPSHQLRCSRSCKSSYPKTIRLAYEPKLDGFRGLLWHRSTRAVHLLCPAHLARQVALADDLVQETVVRGAVGEVATAAHSAWSTACLKRKCSCSTSPFSWATPRLLVVASSP